MIKKFKCNQVFLVIAVRVTILTCAAVLLGGCCALNPECLSDRREQRRDQREAAKQERQMQSHPGLFGLQGWTGSTVWYDSTRQINVAGGRDIDGKKGYPLFVSGCRARCVPGDKWSGNHRIVSGALPPGLDFQPNSDDITGIPTERGTWIVQMELDDITCNGKTYAGLIQELRFHITGTGKVVK